MSKLEIYTNTYSDPSQIQQDLRKLFPLANPSIHPESSGADNHFRISWNQEMSVWRTDSKTGFNIAYHRDPQRAFELHFVKAGHCIFETDEGIVDAPAGTAILLTTATRVNIKGSPDTRKISMSVSFAQFAVVSREDAEDPQSALRHCVQRVDANLPGIANIEQLANILVGGDEAIHPLDPFPVSAQRLRETLIFMFIETWPRTDKRVALDPNYSATLKRALKWMNTHLGEDFTIGVLAKECGASVRTLQSAFKDELGIGPNAYLLRLRLQHAHKDLLERQANETVAIIARRWGFRHLGYFASQYRKLYGNLPSSVQNRSTHP